jgi:hypothetical protein
MRCPSAQRSHLGIWDCIIWHTLYRAIDHIVCMCRTIRLGCKGEMSPVSVSYAPLLAAAMPMAPWLNTSAHALPTSPLTSHGFSMALSEGSDLHVIP